ncbi:MAG TPA: hypothetical protein ENK18_01375 [Deltaproteobacteria bacterium]|nr:hypothetical protein [Deltaproteobacteria bacterium]
MEPTPQPDLLWLARYTVPLHLLLPLGLWGIGRHDPAWAGGLLLAIHLAFPLLLIVTRPRWRGQEVSLLLLLLANHLASLGSAAVGLELAQKL